MEFLFVKQKNKKIQILIFSFLFLTGCKDMQYLAHVSLGQVKLLNQRVSIEKALEKYELTESERKKLKMVSQIKKFALEKLKLDIDEDIYSTYVKLDEAYVSYLLRVAYAYELKAYKWNFPFIGYTPYKGFFDKEKAKEAAKFFPKDKYDTLVRGVAAYSTLNWFEDSILSSMLSYDESDFVVTVFHELAHTVLFFKDHIDFNERFAEFVGRRSAELFYLEKEGAESETLQKMHGEWEDELLFSSFMTTEYGELDEWYKQNKGKVTPEMKQKRLKDIQNRFLRNIQPNLKTNSYHYFSKIKLNNARLLSYRSYKHNTGEFEKLFDSPQVNKSISAFVEYCSQFEEEEDPEVALSEAVKDL